MYPSELTRRRNRVRILDTLDQHVDAIAAPEQFAVKYHRRHAEQLRGTGATGLIAEQNMHFCLGPASHATVIDKGQIVYTSGIEELKVNENIRQR
jgi:hypothetical protein